MQSFYFYLSVFILFFESITVRSQTWKKQITQGSVPARSNSSGIYDSINHRLVMFGGLSSEGLTNTVHCLDLSTMQWSELLTKSMATPAPRFSHNSFYDALNNRMLIWSGQGDVLYNDVWALKFKDSTWENISLNGNTLGKPLQRYGTAAIYNPQSHLLINFAGFTTQGRFGDTWSFDTENLDWKEKTSGTSPPKRCLHSSAYSSIGNRMYIFGGQSIGNLNDLWSLDLGSFEWQVWQSEQVPLARHFTTMVSTGDRILLFGGNTLTQGNHAGGTDDLWQFKYSEHQWEKVLQNDVKPEARSGHIAIYDSKSKSMVVVGGHKTDGIISDDVWTFGPILEATVPVTAGTTNRYEIDVYPNPFQDKLNIDLSQLDYTDNILIYNSKGQKIPYEKVDSEIGKNTMIFTESLLPGIYFIMVQGKKNWYTRQVVKYK